MKHDRFYLIAFTFALSLRYVRYVPESDGKLKIWITDLLQFYGNPICEWVELCGDTKTAEYGNPNEVDCEHAIIKFSSNITAEVDAAVNGRCKNFVWMKLNSNNCFIV